ncbi:Hsp70 family protein [Brevibacterium daeguense]|nr:Hsp70 family protein [Brevibacterium daeguense]
MLGIDFGTTRTVVAFPDRGSYPVVGFETDDGDVFDGIPSLVALAGGELVYGFSAAEAAAAGAPVLRSLKRRLSRPELAPDDVVELGGQEYRLVDLLTGFLTEVRRLLAVSSTLPEALVGDWVAAVAIPAHSLSTARFLTLEAFTGAGFDVRRVLHEPSAAGFEYSHRYARTLSSRRHEVLVYDLGGGTFDASLIDVDDTHHSVRATSGDPHLGGDCFDDVLVELVLDQAELARADLSPAELDRLTEDARLAKEQLHPNSRRLLLHLRDVDHTLEVADFYAACAPLLDRALAAAAPLVRGLSSGESRDSSVAGLHLVGGASRLPIVARSLRESFGRRVHRAPQPHASTAIGLAIALDPDRGFSLEETLGHGLGVYREEAAGADIVFDVIVPSDSPASAALAAPIVRRYRAQHTVGVYRLVEFSRLDEQGFPIGTYQTLATIRFPLDPALTVAEAQDAPVRQAGPGAEITESYRLEPDGSFAVTLRNEESGAELLERFSPTALSDSRREPPQS